MTGRAAQRRARRLWLALGVALVIAVGACGAGSSGNAPHVTSSAKAKPAVKVAAEAAVSAGTSVAQFRTSLIAGGSGPGRTVLYLRFQLPQAARISAASLRLSVQSAGTAAIEVRKTDQPAETAQLTAITAPAVGSLLGTSGQRHGPGPVTIRLGFTAGLPKVLVLAVLSSSADVIRFAQAPSAGAPALLVTTGTADRAPAKSLGHPAVIGAAGDIACDPKDGGDDGPGTVPNKYCAQKATSDLLLSLLPDAVLPLGDTQYSNGTFAKYEASYQPTWGRLLPISHPVPGNHEYLASRDSVAGAGYYEYFGPAAGIPDEGWYSYNLGGWHMVALNGECEQVGGCGINSPQQKWLLADLAAHPAGCTLAYWHEPRFSSGQNGNNEDYAAIWQILYEGGVDVVLNGHDHDYERFAPQDPTEAADPSKGLREFVVGTGGENLRVFHTIVPNSEVRNSDTFGVLRMTLHPGTYTWNFIPAAGGTFTDSGSGTCHSDPGE